jgi:serine/threonine protein kinase
MCLIFGMGLCLCVVIDCRTCSVCHSVVYNSLTASRHYPYGSFAMLQDIARGMCHIHSKSVIHGDLTPTNILLKHDTSRPR